jgi:hypothetical protein
MAPLPQKRKEQYILTATLQIGVFQLYSREKRFATKNITDLVVFTFLDFTDLPAIDTP